MFTTKDTLGAELPYYGIMIILGISACIILLLFTRKKRQNINSIEYVCMGLISAIGAFFGAHIMFGISNIDKIAFIISHPHRLFSSFQMFMIYINDILGGMVFYGGLIGACISSYIYMKVLKLDVSEYSDTLAPCIPMFHAFGRLGCFFTGCCYGIESDFGFTYYYSIVESANGVNRLPIQLFESIENIIICIILILILCMCKNITRGILIWIYGLIYPVIRFINEFFRGDFEERGYFGIFSTSQWISIIIFVFSLIMIILSVTRNKKNIKQNEIREV